MMKKRAGREACATFLLMGQSFRASMAFMTGQASLA